MATKISSREVLAYLNELGYNNISAQELKEFMKDLKKLIKYEERKRFQEDLQREYLQEYVGETSPKKKENVDEIFTNLHSHQTVASKAKTKPKKESIIHVQIKRSKMQSPCNQDKENIPVENSNKTDNVDLELDQAKNIEGPAREIKNRLADSEPTKSATSSRKTSSKKSSNKPKSSFIRPPIHVNMKSDPVALYHYYQEVWKTAKIPGEDSRADLRWTIREKMMQGPRIMR